LGQPEQPGVEQFENDLYEAMAKLDGKRRVWIEDESHAIGRVYIPQGLWQQMKVSPMVVMDLPLELRVQRLLREYAGFGVEQLRDAMQKIRKRLGGQNLKLAQSALEQKDYATTARIALRYYDKAYEHGLGEQSELHRLQLEVDKPRANAQLLIEKVNKHNFPA
jgi:tRNA 2-selenouridine synthase